MNGLYSKINRYLIEEKGKNKRCMKAPQGFMGVITSGRVEGVEHEDELR